MNEIDHIIASCSNENGEVVGYFLAGAIQSILACHGYQVVPKEPTKEMIEIGMGLVAHPCWPENLIKAYKSMLVAAKETQE